MYILIAKFGGKMKKLLLGAMMVALFIGNAEGRNVRGSISSIKQSTTDFAKRGAKKVGDIKHNMTHRSDIVKKSRKSNIEDDVFTQNMGANYQPTLRAINATLGGWIDVLKNSEKDEQYSLNKADIKYFRQTLEAVYEFTTAVQKKKTKLDRLSADAEGALDTFTQEKLNSFLNTPYGMDNLLYLTNALASIRNALMTLVYTDEQINIGGTVWSSAEGINFNKKVSEVEGFMHANTYEPTGNVSEESQVRGVWEAFDAMFKQWIKQKKVISKSAKQSNEDVNTERDREASIDDENVTPQKARKTSRRSRSANAETEEIESSPKVSRKSLKRSKSMDDISGSKVNRRSSRKTRSMSDLED